MFLYGSKIFTVHCFALHFHLNLYFVAHVSGKKNKKKTESQQYCIFRSHCILFFALSVVLTFCQLFFDVFFFRFFYVVIEQQHGVKRSLGPTEKCIRANAFITAKGKSKNRENNDQNEAKRRMKNFISKKKTMWKRESITSNMRPSEKLQVIKNEVLFVNSKKKYDTTANKSDLML